jgi:hypothetical protein
MSIENCLPASARQQYLRVRNQKSESARQSYQTTLFDLRAKSAATGVIRSGYQELAEWNLTEEFLGQLAQSWFEAAIETCKLYEIPLDQNLCKCIEDGVRELLVAQYQNSLTNTGSGVGGVKMPLSARHQVVGRLQGCRFPILNTIQIELEKERVESQRRQRDNMPRSLTPEEKNILAALSDPPEQLQLDQLAQRASTPDRASLLRTIESLRIRGYIKFIALKDNDALVDAANITILPAGLKFIEDAESQSSMRAGSVTTMARPGRGNPDSTTSDQLSI